MRRIIHSELMRKPRDQRAAILLWLGLIAILCASLAMGVQGLAS